jgi:DNA-binding transcriptional ArsR family regulator
MVKYMQQAHVEEINLIFHSLADPTRRRILERLTTTDLTVTEIAEPYEMSLPAISKHLKILEHAKLIGRKKQGREYQIHLEPQTLKTVIEYISFYEAFWNNKLTQLEEFLKKE